MMKFDKELAKFYAKGDFSSKAYKDWKHAKSVELVENLQSVVSYYMVNKYIGDRPFFDPEDPTDFKVIGAVTNAFANFRPNDPRTGYMVDNFKQGLSMRRSESSAGDTIVATTASLIDIKLQDKKGKMQSLQEVASHGNVVVLNFTMQSQSFSPSLNKLLNDMYNKYKGRGFEVFQVCLDDNEAQWMQAVVSLPWIVLRDPDGEYSRNAGAYNITTIPTVFIIGRNGEIVERVENIEQLEGSLQKYI